MCLLIDAYTHDPFLPPYIIIAQVGILLFRRTALTQGPTVQPYGGVAG